MYNTINLPKLNTIKARDSQSLYLDESIFNKGEAILNEEKIAKVGRSKTELREINNRFSYLKSEFLKIPQLDSLANMKKINPQKIPNIAQEIINKHKYIIKKYQTYREYYILYLKYALKYNESSKELEKLKLMEMENSKEIAVETLSTNEESIVTNQQYSKDGIIGEENLDVKQEEAERIFETCLQNWEYSYKAKMDISNYIEALNKEEFKYRIFATLRHYLNNDKEMFIKLADINDFNFDLLHKIPNIKSMK